MACRLSYLAAFGIFPDQGSDLCLLHWQADSLPLSHQGSPRFKIYFESRAERICCWFGCVCLVVQLCPTLCDLMGYSRQASLSMEILQARILQWVAMPSSRGSSQPRDGTQVSRLQVDSVLSEPPGKPIYIYLYMYIWLCWVFIATQFFPSCGKQGLLSSCGTWAFYCGGVSRCRAQTLEHKGFICFGSQALECRLRSCGARA